MMNQTLCPCEMETYLERFHQILKTMVCRMTSVHLLDSISYNFIVQMIPHHQAAIQMSKNIRRYTDDSQIAEIAENIISTQEKSIHDMLSIQKSCRCCRNCRRELCSYQNELYPIFDTMFERMANARSTQQINCNFLREMIPHHEGAVQMSCLTLSQQICPQLIPILEAIIREQEQGIQQMKELLLSCPDYNC